VAIALEPIPERGSRYVEGMPEGGGHDVQRSGQVPAIEPLGDIDRVEGDRESEVEAPRPILERVRPKGSAQPEEGLP